jgi:hypothetical protein
MTIGAIRILGVDPGLRKTGWGVIEAAGSRLIFIACGSIKTDAATARRATGGDPSLAYRVGRTRGAA